MLRNKILMAAGVAGALGVAGCNGNTSGTAAGPPTPTFDSSSPTAAPSSPSSGPSAPPPAASTGEQPTEAAGPGECRASELKLSIGHGDAAAGTAYRPLRFTNSGQRSCTIQGFPG